MTQKEAVVRFLKRNRRYVDGTALMDEFGPGALRSLRKARAEGLNVSKRKSPEGVFQYKVS